MNVMNDMNISYIVIDIIYDMKILIKLCILSKYRSDLHIMKYL